MNQGTMNMTDAIGDYESVKGRLLMQAVGTEENRGRLSDLPHRKMEDMSIIYRVLLDADDRGIASSVVTHDMLKAYGISEEQLYADACVSQKEHSRVRPLSAVLAGYGTEIPDNEPTDQMLFVATNDRAAFGSGVIAQPGFMEEAKDLLGGSFFVLPSSIHEVLLLRDDGSMNYGELLHMVKSINFSIVDPAEKLTDNVYHYDANERVFETAKNYTLRQHGRPSVLKNLEDKKEEIAKRKQRSHTRSTPPPER